MFDIPTWPTWLKVKVLLTVAWHLAWTAFAAAAPPPATTVMGFMSGTKDAGLGYVPAKGGWDAFGQSVAKYPAIWIHNPFGVFNANPPMQFNQASRLAKLAESNPALAVRADKEAFIKAMQSLATWKGIYFGSPQTYQPDDPAINNPVAWCEAAKLEIQWALDARPNVIGIDNWKGEPARNDNKWLHMINGPEGGAVLLMRWLQKECAARGIELACEPGPLRCAPVEFFDNSVVLGDVSFWQLHDKANDWSTFHSLGPMREPRFAPRVYRILDLVGTDEMKLAYIESEREKTGHVPIIRATQAPASLK